VLLSNYIHIFLSYLNKRLVLLAIGGTYFIVLLLNHLSLLHWTPPCLIKSVLGHACLGCGTNSAILALLNGELLYALEINPLGILAVLTALLLLIYDIKIHFQLQKPTRCKT